MGNVVGNISKGKFAEYAARVNANDPTNAVFVFDLLATTGIEADSVLIDKDDFTALVSGATNYATGTGWVRKSIDQAGGITITTDDTNDRQDVDFADITWTAVADAADDVSGLVSGYDSDSTGGTDTNIVLVSKHDYVIQPDGSDVVAQISVLLRAS